MAELWLRVWLAFVTLGRKRGVARAAVPLLGGMMFPGKAAASAPVEAVEAPDEVLEEEQEQGPIRIHVDPSITDASFVIQWIREHSAGIAERFPEVPDHDQWIWIEITGVTYDYQVRVVAMRDGVPVGIEPEMVSCECTSDALLEVIDAEIGHAVGQLDSSWLKASKAEEDASESKDRAPESEPVEEEVRLAEDMSRSTLGRLGYGGVALAIIGAATIGAGVPLAVHDSRWKSRDLLEVRHTKRPGIAISGVGGAMLIAGVVMVVVGTRRARRCSVMVVPTAGPHMGGMSLWLRL